MVKKAVKQGRRNACHTRYRQGKSVAVCKGLLEKAVTSPALTDVEYTVRTAVDSKLIKILIILLFIL